MHSPLLIQLPTWLLVIVSVLKVDAAISLAKPGCNDTCGGVSIPFPFGIGAGCFLHPWFEVDCKAPPNPNGSAKPLLSKLGIEVMMMSSSIPDLNSQQLLVLIPPTNSCTAHTHKQSIIDLRGSPYQLTASTVLVMEGCPGSANLVNEYNTILGRCDTSCLGNNNATATETCSGSNCCQGGLDLNFDEQFYQIEFDNPSQICLLAALLSPDYDVASALQPPATTVPVHLSWVWGNYTFDNSSHSTCYAFESYQDCNCDQGYEGNPYFSDGCQVSEECKGCNGTQSVLNCPDYCHVELEPVEKKHVENNPFPIAAGLGHV